MALTNITGKTIIHRQDTTNPQLLDYFDMYGVDEFAIPTEHVQEFLACFEGYEIETQKHQPGRCCFPVKKK